MTLEFLDRSTGAFTRIHRRALGTVDTRVASPCLPSQKLYADPTGTVEARLLFRMHQRAQVPGAHRSFRLDVRAVGPTIGPRLRP